MSNIYYGLILAIPTRWIFAGQIYIYRSLRAKFAPVLANECDCMMAATNKTMPMARKAIHNSIVRANASASSFIANAYKKNQYNQVVFD